MQLAPARAGLTAERDRHRQHARHRHGQRRRAGVRGAAAGVRRLSERTCFNNTKSFIGHAMGAAGALELAGNLPAFDDGVCHATINVDRARSRVRAAGPGAATSRAKLKRVDVHPEQFVRDAGHQFGRHRQTSVSRAASQLRFDERRMHEGRMTPAEIREVFSTFWQDIAPDEDLSGLKDDVAVPRAAGARQHGLSRHRDGAAQATTACRFPRTTTCSWRAWTARWSTSSR